MSSVIKIDPEIMSGASCFAGTRVPIQNLIDYLEGGDSIEEFLEGFPSVSREQVIAFLEEAKDRMPNTAIAEAEQDIANGRLVTHEQMKARIAQWSGR